MSASLYIQNVCIKVQSLLTALLHRPKTKPLENSEFMFMKERKRNGLNQIRNARQKYPGHPSTRNLLSSGNDTQRFHMLNKECSQRNADTYKINV